MASELNKLTIADASSKLRAREITATQLTRDCLDRIARAEPRLHAFITVCEKEALEQARAADARLAAGHAPARHQGYLRDEGHSHDLRVANPRDVRAAV